MRMALFQGEGCKRAYLKRSLAISDEHLERIQRGDTLILTLVDVETQTSGMGYNSLEIALGDRAIEVTVPPSSEPSTMVYTWANAYDLLSLTANGDDVDNVHSTTRELIESSDEITLSVDACGADLYASASMSMASFRIELVTEPGS